MKIMRGPDHVATDPAKAFADWDEAASHRDEIKKEGGEKSGGGVTEGVRSVCSACRL